MTSCMPYVTSFLICQADVLQHNLGAMVEILPHNELRGSRCLSRQFIPGLLLINVGPNEWLQIRSNGIFRTSSKHVNSSPETLKLVKSDEMSRNRMENAIANYLQHSWDMGRVTGQPMTEKILWYNPLRVSFPLNTWRNNSVDITSKQGHFDVIT